MKEVLNLKKGDKLLKKDKCAVKTVLNLKESDKLLKKDKYKKLRIKISPKVEASALLLHSGCARPQPKSKWFFFGKLLPRDIEASWRRETDQGQGHWWDNAKSGDRILELTEFLLLGTLSSNRGHDIEASDRFHPYDKICHVARKNGGFK